MSERLWVRVPWKPGSATYFKMLNNPSLLKDILSLLCKYAKLYLQSDLKKRIRLSLIIDLANNSIGRSGCHKSTSKSDSG